MNKLEAAFVYIMLGGATILASPFLLALFIYGYFKFRGTSR